MEPVAPVDLGDASASELYARIRPSLVDVHVPRPDEGELHTLGVVVEEGGVTAWSGVDAAGRTWENVSAISIRQAPNVWSAEMFSLKVDYGLCILRVHEPFSIPVVPWRRSNTLAMGDRLLYAVAGPEDGAPRLGWAELIDVYVQDKKSYRRAYVWTARLDPAMPRAYAFAFDGDGRVAGLLEPLPDLPVAALLAGEWVGRLVEHCWVEMMLRLEPQQVVREYRKEPDRYEAEAQCGIGAALLRTGDEEAAIGAWRRAVARDPLNPWPFRALGSLLRQGLNRDRLEEAKWLLQRAAQLEALEPEGPPEDPADEAS